VFVEVKPFAGADGIDEISIAEKGDGFGMGYG
jgi:hypothetical protein